MPGETSQALPDYGALPGSQSPGVLLLSAVSEQVTCSSSVLGKLPTNAKATEKRKQPKVTLAPTLTCEAEKLGFWSCPDSSCLILCGSNSKEGRGERFQMKAKLKENRTSEH